jgi:hypothetical protein
LNNLSLSTHTHTHTHDSAILHTLGVEWDSTPNQPNSSVNLTPNPNGFHPSASGPIKAPCTFPLPHPNRPYFPQASASRERRGATRAVTTRRSGAQPSAQRGEPGRSGGQATVCAGSKLRHRAGRRGHDGCAASVQRRNAGSRAACGSQRLAGSGAGRRLGVGTAAHRMSICPLEKSISI